jgi:outer membrane biosynthesis protein TonB
MVARRRAVLSDHRDGVGLGLAVSALLHLAVAALVVFGLPHLITPPPDIVEPMIVELADIGDKTTPPPRQVESPKPDEQPPAPPKAEPQPEPPKPEPPKPEPPKPEPPKPAPPPPPPEPEPIPVPAVKPKPPEPAKPDKVQDVLKDIKPPAKKPPPPDDSDSLLKTLAKLRQSASPPPSPTPASPALSTKTVNSPVTDLSSKPTASERDYVSAQIWPHWNVDLGAKQAATLQVGVRITIQPDGTVTSATLVVDQSRYDSDTFYQAAAEAAKRAVLQASPLKVPPSRPDMFRNNPVMTINFDPRSIAR